MHKHKKCFGQNFLNSDSILHKIMDVSNISSEDTILEIGPGEGALTEYLLDRAKRVICVEIDKDLEKILRRKFGDRENFTLIMGDVLEQDFSEFLDGETRVVANIPYYITSPIINKLIDNRKYVKDIYIMVQKELAERISADAGDRNKSVLTAVVDYYGKSEYLFTIDKTFFTPPPKVDSAFLGINLYSDNRYEKLISEELYLKYAKAAFANKRKNIVNNLSLLGFSKDIIREKLTILNISHNMRAEGLSIDEFISIANEFEKENN